MHHPTYIFQRSRRDLLYVSRFHDKREGLILVYLLSNTDDELAGIIRIIRIVRLVIKTQWSIYDIIVSKTAFYLHLSVKTCKFVAY